MGYNVDLVFKAIDQTKQATDSAKSNIKGVEQTTKGAKSNFKEFGQVFADSAKLIAKGAGFITAEVMLMKKIFDFGEQGAQVLQTAESFDYLMKKVGAGPETLDELRAASRGTVDDMKIMSSTATLLAGATGDLASQLAQSTPELMEIAKAANKLNPMLGDTTFLYDSLAKGIKRASPLILDNLGIIVRVEEANQRYAESIGKAASELTAEEQKIALLNETLRSGRVLIDQAGGSADSLTDSFQRMGAEIKNTSDSIKAYFAPALSNAADAITLALTWEKQLTIAMTEQEKRVYSSTNAYIEYYKQMVSAGEKAGYSIDEMVQKQMFLTKTEYEAAKTQDDLTHAIYNGIYMLNQLGIETTTVTEGVSLYEQAVKANASTTRGWTEETYKAYRGLDQTNTTVRDLANANDALSSAMGKVKSAAEAYTTGTGNELASMLEQRLGPGSERYRDALDDIDAVMGTSLAKEAEHKDNLKKIMDEYARTGDQTKFRENLQALRDAELPGVTEELKDAVLEAKNLREELLGLPKSIQVDIKINKSGDLEYDFYRPSSAPGASAPRTKWGGEADGAQGLDFTVPPGYPNDSFRVNVQSGEHVTVTKPGQAKPAVNFYGPVTFQSFDPAQLTNYGVN